MPPRKANNKLTVQDVLKFFDTNMMKDSVPLIPRTASHSVSKTTRSTNNKKKTKKPATAK